MRKIEQRSKKERGDNCSSSKKGWKEKVKEEKAPVKKKS